MKVLGLLLAFAVMAAVWLYWSRQTKDQTWQAITVKCLITSAVCFLTAYLMGKF